MRYTRFSTDDEDDFEDVEEIGRALGVEYEDAEELKGADKITERDKHRWEYNPASAEDYPEAEENLLSSIEWARRQSATLFELKSAIDLAELLLVTRLLRRQLPSGAGRRDVVLAGTARSPDPTGREPRDGRH